MDRPTDTGDQYFCRKREILENLHDLDDDTVAVAAGPGFIGQLAELLIQAGANEGP